MKSISLIGALLFAGAAHAASTSADQNWAQWRGPLQTGVAPKADPPIEWSETKNVKWKVKIPGLGTATPIIWENKVFILTAIPTGKKNETAGLEKLNTGSQVFGIPQAAQEQPPPRRGPGGPGRGPGGRGGGAKPTEIFQFATICFDRQTGKMLWQQIAREQVPHEGHHPQEGNFAPASALTDGERVFSYFGSRGLYCYDMDGKLQWSEDFGDSQMLLSFGEGSTPALSGDILVVTWDNEAGSFIVAVDKKTGKTLWKKERAEKTSWATPLIVEHEGKRQVVTAATSKIRSYDLATGELIWECAGLKRNVIPTPVAGHGMVYCMSGFQGSALLAIRLGKTGDLTDSDAIAWKYDKSTPYVPSPLLYDDKLYFFAVNSGRISCYNAQTGAALIDAAALEAVPNVYASPVGASQRVYVAGRNGTTVVLKNSGTLDILATNKLDEKFDASPAIAGKELFLRGRENLYCIAVN